MKNPCNLGTPTYHYDNLSRTVAVPKAVIGQKAQQDVKYQRRQVAGIQQGLDEGDSAHCPITAQFGGVKQQPGVYWQEVVKCHLPGRGGTDGSWIIKPDDG